jgi:putative ABC transport system permease protein
VLATEIAALPGVTGTSFAAATPGDTTGTAFTRAVTVPGFMDVDISLYPKAVEANFFDVYEIPLVSGRAFSADLASDRFMWPQENTSGVRSSAVLNAAAVQAAGFASAEAAVGNTIRMQGVDLDVVGVVPDVNFQSLRSAVTPNMYILSPADFLTLTVAYGADADESALLERIRQTWNALVPGVPLAFDFVDDNIRAQYAQDRLQFLLITVFSSLAITIACLGLYALTAWSTRRRTREIGIRKVHGALNSDILKVLLLQFTRPVLIANVLSWPVAWYVMDWYLSGFAYRIEPGPSLFVLASLATVAIAWSAIMLHVIRAANAKPVAALRYE